MSKNIIDLTDAIIDIRRQLQLAHEEGLDKDVRFSIQSLEVELKCCVRKEKEGKGGLKLFVLTGEGRKKSSNSRLCQNMHK